MKRVLVVDDDTFWRRNIADFFKEKGYLVYTAKDGLEGISKAIKYKPDIIVVDYILPKVSGSYVVRFLRMNDTFKEAGIVMTSISSDVMNEYWARNYGADLFIEKEKGIDEALKRLSNFIVVDFSSKKSGYIEINTANIETLMEVIDEDLRREKVNRDILELVERVDDEKYVMRRLWMMFSEVLEVEDFFSLILSTSSGRIHAYSNRTFGVDRERVERILISKLERPITPSEWIWDGNVKPYGENGVKFDVFHVVTYRGMEQGILAFGLSSQEKKEKIYTFIKDTKLSLSILFRTLNTFRDYKTAAEVDSLTGLLTKKMIMMKLEEYLRLLNRQGVPFSLAMMDIDHFKRINDTYGHVKGDEVLRKIGELILENLRETDVAGRYGGEEFLVIFPGSDVDMASRGVERVLNAVRSYDWDSIGVSRVTMSAGVVEAVEGKTVTELVEMADEKLYEAKNSGRDRMVVGRRD